VLRVRGIAYYAKGELDHAIADLDEAIRLNPKDKDALANRANTYRAKGNLDRAIADYDQLVQLDPRNARAYFHRARFYWQGASFAKSLADLDQANQLNPKDAYPIIWREIVARRSDQASRLSEAAKQLDATKWPAPIVNLFLGTMTPEQVLGAANDADPMKKKAQLCEANFYIGERALQSGSRDEALKLFEQASADCPKTFIEKQAADVELSALRASR
jgi:lipoprotein NlpI